MTSAERERLQKARATPTNSPALVAYIDRLLAGLPLEQTRTAADNGAGTTRKPPSPKKKSPATRAKSTSLRAAEAQAKAGGQTLPPPWAPFRSPFPIPQSDPAQAGGSPSSATTETPRAAKREWHARELQRAQRATAFHEQQLALLRRP